MDHRVEVSLPVPAARAWETLADLRAWPRWTPTVESLESATPRPVVGTEVVVKQPGRTPARYRIDLVEDGRRFRWGSARAGVRQVADHVVVPTSESRCTVTLTFAMDGPVGRPLAALGAGRIRRMVETEARALAAAVAPQQASD